MYIYVYNIYIYYIYIYINIKQFKLMNDYMINVSLCPKYVVKYMYLCICECIFI